jgi:hypothetical protein
LEQLNDILLGIRRQQTPLQCEPKVIAIFIIIRKPVLIVLKNYPEEGVNCFACATAFCSGRNDISCPKP